jgi:hypothetical protein
MVAQPILTGGCKDSISDARTRDSEGPSVRRRSCPGSCRRGLCEPLPRGFIPVGVVGALMMLAGVDGNGSVLILADTAGLVLLGGTTLLVVGAIAWPRFAPRTTRYDMGEDSSERTLQP